MGVPALGINTTQVLVAPQGFEPRLSESESLVLPLNERAAQVCYDGRRLGGSHNQPPLQVYYSSRKTSNGFCPSTRWLAAQPAITASTAVVPQTTKFIRI